MTSSITMTMASLVEVRRLHFREDVVQENVENLLTEMLQSGLFSEKTLDSLVEWGDAFFQLSLKTAQDQERGAKALADLLCNTLLPYFVRTNDAGKIRLHKFKEQLESSLVMLLPRGSDVEKYVENFSKASDKDALCEFRKTLSKQHTRSLQQQKIAVQAEVHSAFEAMKKDIGRTQASLNSAEDEIEPKVDAMEASLLQANAKLQKVGFKVNASFDAKKALDQKIDEISAEAREV